MHQLFKTSLWILCLVAAASADVIVVDAVGGAGADFTALQPAIDAAADGDILLVRDGLYEPFSIAGKGLVITADAGATIRLDPGSLTVSGVPAGSAVSLTGLESDAFMFAGQLVHSSVTLGLTSNVGPVSLRDCEFSANVATGAAFIIDDGTRVVMSDCSLFGLTLLNGTPEAALLVEDAELYASRCSITGLVGAPGNVLGGLPGGPGSAGLIVRDSVVVLDECDVTGGGGGQANVLFGCADGGDGGTGLVVEGAASDGLLRDTPVTAGAGSAFAGTGTCTDGSDGLAIEWLAGALSVQTGSSRGLAVPSPAREFELFTVTLTGADDEVVYALLSLAADPLFDAGSNLLIYGAAPLKVRFVGSLPAAAAVQLAMPPVPTVVQGVTVRMQAVFVDPVTTQVRASGAQDVVVLDSAF